MNLHRRVGGWAADGRIYRDDEVDSLRNRWPCNPLYFDDAGELPDVPLPASVYDVADYCNAWLSFVLGDIARDLANPIAIYKPIVVRLRGTVTSMIDAPPLPENQRVDFGKPNAVADELRRWREWARRASTPSNEPINEASEDWKEIAGEEALKILEIANSDESADTKMRDICKIDLRYLSWDSPKWANLLKVSDAAIRKTLFWKSDRDKAVGAEIALRNS